MLAPIHPASPSPDPAGSPLWLEWIMLPVTTVALAQLVALEIYAQMVLGRWPGPPGLGPFWPSRLPQPWAMMSPPARQSVTPQS
jgi:hypothetical protein